jgi:hypothetical protein
LQKVRDATSVIADSYLSCEPLSAKTDASLATL